FDAQDLQTQPSGLRRPGLGGGAIERATVLGCKRVRDVVDVAPGISGIARAHQRFGRRRARVAAEVQAATALKIKPGIARTSHAAKLTRPRAVKNPSLRFA